MSALPPEFVATREALHVLARHLLSHAFGSETLRANESGFATQEVNGTTYTVSGPFLTDGERSLLLTGSTLRGVADWMGVSTDDEHDLDLDAPLAIDSDCAVMLGEWFAGMQIVLSSVFPDHELKLFPEHFDLATSIHEANFGASPGDEHIAEPYIYFGPWNEPFIPMSYSMLLQATDPLAAAEGFFRQNLKRLLAAEH